MRLGMRWLSVIEELPVSCRKERLRAITWKVGGIWWIWFIWTDWGRTSFVLWAANNNPLLWLASWFPEQRPQYQNCLLDWTEILWHLKKNDPKPTKQSQLYARSSLTLQVEIEYLLRFVWPNSEDDCRFRRDCYWSMGLTMDRRLRWGYFEVSSLLRLEGCWVKIFSWQSG